VLASAHRTVHGPVELAVDRAVLALPDSVQLTAFRLVQEALTNIRKHAPGATAQVSVTVDHGTVVVNVDDDGDQHPAAAGGFGLHGMRERVALFSGTFEAGRAPTAIPRPGDAASRNRSGADRMTDDIRVVVVDDQGLVRAGFVALLAGEPGIEVVGEAGQGEEAVRLGRRHDPWRCVDGRPHAGDGRDRGDPTNHR
jgi:hypothetical protein